MGIIGICLIESFQMSTNIMRSLLCEGVMIWVYIPLVIESFQMSTNMRSLLCEGV